MGDYIDAVFEADCPKYVDFAEPQPLEDNADEWFNFDHENGIPVEFDSPEKMDASNHSKVDQQTVNQSSQSVRQLSNSAIQSSESATQSSDCDDYVPSPLQLADLSAPSPGVPKRTPLVTRLLRSDVQNNLDLINTSSNSNTTPGGTGDTVEESETIEAGTIQPDLVVAAAEADEQQGEAKKSDDEPSKEVDLPCKAKKPFTNDTRPSNPVTNWTTSSSDATSEPTAKKPCTTDTRPCNLVTNWTTSSSETTSIPIFKPSKLRRSGSISKKTATVAPSKAALSNLSSKLMRSNSVRRSTRSVGGTTPLTHPVRSRSLNRRSADTTRVSRASSAEATPTKRKRYSSPAPGGQKKVVRKSLRLQRPKLTMPYTPVCLKRNMVKPGQSKFKSSEEIEMERIKLLRQETKKAIMTSQKSHKQAMEALSYHPVRSVVEPTKPEEFRFETDSRIKDHSMETRQDRDLKDFVAGLRKHDPSPKKNRGPTVPKPFHFAEHGRKRRNEESDPSGMAHKFKPMALAINEFHARTPERFRTKATKDNKGPIPIKAVHIKPALTCPKTPCFETKTRKRPITAISAVEKEEMAVQEMKSYSFRAKPVDPRVMSNVNMGVTKPQHKEPTKAVGFDLESEKRFREKEANKKPQEEEEESREFHARPLPSKMFEGVTGLVPVKPMPITCPKSPAFALKNRVRVYRRSNVSQMEEEDKAASKIVHAHPVPHMGVPFVPNLNHKVTESKPFSFANRDKDTQIRKEAKIQEKLKHEEQLANQFKAQPLPNIDDVKLPEKKARPVTKPQPFMSMEERGAKQAEQWSKKIEEEINEQRQLANQFKAKPADVLYEAPFVPQKSTRALTDVSDFELNTNRRATERQEFEGKKQVRETNLRIANEERLRQEEEEERHTITRLRQEMVHKTNPIRQFKTVDVHPSTKPLTQPESPNFATDARLRSQPRL